MRRILAGETNKKDKKQEDLDSRIFELVSNYDKHELLEYMDLLEATLQKDSIFVSNNNIDEIINGVASL